MVLLKEALFLLFVVQWWKQWARYICPKDGLKIHPCFGVARQVRKALGAFRVWAGFWAYLQPRTTCDI